MVASYRLGIIGYAAGMVLSLLGEVPAGVIVVTAASLAAIALFVFQVTRLTTR